MNAETDQGSSDEIGGIIEHSAGEGPTPALGIYETGQGPLTAALSEPETAAEKDDLGRSRPWVASLPRPTPRSGKIESGREALKMKLSDAPGLPLSELRMPKPRTMTFLAPDRLPNMIRFYGLERRKRLARLSRISAAGKRWALERQRAGPACSRSKERSTQMGNPITTGGDTSPQIPTNACSKADRSTPRTTRCKRIASNLLSDQFSYD